MNPKIRYLLIFAGIAFFMIAAPLILFFASGLKYDFQTNQFISTGILALKTDPKDAKIFLDDKLVNEAVRETREIRFLKPKSYQLTLKRDEFFDWNKTLTVETNKVTWANEQSDKIYLLLKNQTAAKLAEGIIDFTAWPEGLLAISDKQLFVSPGWDMALARTLPLPKPVSNISASPDFRFFLLTQPDKNSASAQVLLFERSTEKFYDLAALFDKQAALPKFEFSRDGRLFALMDGSLYEIRVRELSRQLVSAQILAFTLEDQTAYMLISGPGASKLTSLDIESGQNQTLFSDLPQFKNAELVVNPQKHIFLIGDNALYAASTGGLVLLSENVAEWTFKQQENSLAFLASGELKYATDDNKTSLVTRVSDQLFLPKIQPAFGYAFYVKNNSLYALTLDPQGQQNAYQLYSGSNIQKYELDKEFRKLLILDAGSLNLLKIR